MNEQSDVEAEFPSGLLKWSGHRGGGVKRPFHEGSGRPTGSHIETPVIARLRSWVDSLLIAPKTSPTAVLLVGGPGNGKTDAVQVLIEYLDERLGAKKRLVGECVRIYTASEDALAPRQASLVFTDFAKTLPKGLPKQLRLVQDASEDPQQSGTSRGKLLATELLQCYRNPSEAIYVCCANRGVVSEALAAAKFDASLGEVVPILEELLESITSGPKDISCWPLPSAPRIAAWPMDVESLTAAGDGLIPVCQGFIRIATDERHWPTKCAAGSRCPFCTNRHLLANDDVSSALCSLLRFFELSSGKRWTFRDLFSLIPHIIVGDDREYVTKALMRVPCEWAAEQIKKAKTTSIDAVKIKLNLVSRLYQHRLFPLWPTFSSGAHLKAAKELGALKVPELYGALGLMSWFAARRRTSDTDISKLIATSWSEVLDPALANGEVALIDTQKKQSSVQEVEERFSLSVADGLDLVRLQISELERDLLKELIVSDNYLSSQAYPRRLSSSARLIQQVVRQFAARLVKRSIGTRKGVCKGVIRLREYLEAARSSDELKGFRKSLQSLLHDDRSRFSASLATTFGQPAPYRSRDVRLITSKVSVKTVKRSKSQGRPIDLLPYVRIGSYVVPVTMELFSSLSDRDCGLRAASLPPAVFALFDTTRSIVTGETSRDPLMLEEEVLIEIGGCRQGFQLEDGQITATNQG